MGEIADELVDEGYSRWADDYDADEEYCGQYRSPRHVPDAYFYIRDAITETEKAWLLVIELSNGKGSEQWFPKSHCSIIWEHTSVRVPEWLRQKKKIW